MQNVVPANRPLSIAVIGPGGIGSTFAFNLARAGHEVTVIARPGSARLAQLQRDNGVVDKAGARPTMRVADRLDETIPFDLVLVTTLAHQVDAVLPALQRSQARWVQFMFNTFDPEGPRNTVGAQRCSLGMPFVAATVDGEGRLNATINPGQKTLHGDRRWVDLFNGAGLPSVFESDMPLWLRCHAPMCIAMESICFQGQRRGRGASWAEAMTVARGVRAGYAVIEGLGYPVYPSSKAALKGAPTFLIAGMLWIVSRIAAFRDLLATGVNECRALVDVMVAAAAEAKAVPAGAIAAILAMKPPVEPGTSER
jgi:2-dehydropantoate 2-reductase